MNPFRLLALLLLSIFGAAVSAAAPGVDQTLEATARESYNFKYILDDRVVISVQDGIATLTGRAPYSDLRTLAADTVRSIPGIRRVNNRVVVDSTIPEYSDAWIALKVRNSLRVRTGLDPTRIQLSVTDRMLRLSGTVATAQQKQLAERYAGELVWVRGVANEVSVSPATPEDAPFEGTMDDASISTQLKYLLDNEGLTTAPRAAIVTQNGIVSIVGHAVSAAEKTHVSSIAATIRGVKTVRNDMLVRP
jgi:hyperosmotically inducible periplasmic protein